MNVQDLVSRLKAAGPDECAFDVRGEVVPGSLPDGVVVLANDDGRWQVGTAEQGTRSVDAEFESEEDACARVWEIRAWQSPAPVRLTDEEFAAAAAFNRDVQNGLRQTSAPAGYAPVAWGEPVPATGARLWVVALRVAIPLLLVAIISWTNWSIHHRNTAASPPPDLSTDFPLTEVPSLSVGSCLQGDAGQGSLTSVPCGPGVRYKLVGEYDDEVEAAVEAGLVSCTSFATANVVSWQPGQISALGTVLCLDDTTAAQRPAVGDCLTGGADSTDGTTLVAAPCGKGMLRVLGKIDDTTEIYRLNKSVEQVCPEFPGADRSYWQGFGNTLTGTTYCLDTLRK